MWLIKTVDDLGRIVIPKEFWQALDIKAEDEINVSIHLNEIRIKKATLGCIFCSAAIRLVRIGDKCVCLLCIERLHKAGEGETLYPN